MFKVTIGLSVYNAGKYLKDCIQSILNQTYKNIEIIILNDGSSDNSFEIVNGFNDSRILYIDDGLNKGLVFRLNQMVKIASGDFFVRMDADDIMFPDRIEQQLNVFKQYPNTDIVHSSAISIDESNNVLGLKLAASEITRENVLNGIIPIHPTVMGKKEWFLQNIYVSDFYLMEDFELWYRTAYSSAFKNTSSPVLFYRELSQNNSFKYLKMIPSKREFARKYTLSYLFKIKFIYSNYFKFCYHKVFEILSMQKIAVKNRYSSLNSEEIIIYNNVLNLSTKNE